MDWSKVSELAS